MLYPSKEEYLRLAETHDIVPVFKEVLADLETPVSVLQRFAECENAFLLESMEGGETWGRYSFVGIGPELLFEADHRDGATGELENLRSIYSDLKVAELPGLPRFFGGVVGFVGYEAIGEFERMPSPKAGSQRVVPRSRFLKVDKLIIFDNVRHTLKIVFCTRPKDAVSAAEAYESAEVQIEKVAASLPEQHATPALTYPDVSFESNMSRDDYKAMVQKAKQYIVDGDIIQVVLSQRFSAQSEIPPLQLYRALRLLNPSPYTYFLKLGDQVLVGSSPEIMVRLTGSRVEVRPIAGTRPRGATEQEDRALADELLSDQKEKAEHVMLVDLGRNDVGRIAESGSVQVTDYMVIERYSHVMHMVSHVEGILRKEFDAYDVLRATFPAGTLSGAPKIRAMEVIHELEPSPRGAYGGALGYISYTGNMDVAITIRTLEVEAGEVSIQAGAGIVYDSDPDLEYEETCHKARGMQKAVEMAARGLEIGKS
ncbi:MAG: anthranilate synthase component I [Verrucomicrobia bacterium]|jgi:anthranilate synthase component I|nr:anthranilate synthase component I [Verrucomicrobiota bacterium]